MQNFLDLFTFNTSSSSNNGLVITFVTVTASRDLTPTIPQGSTWKQATWDILARRFEFTPNTDFVIPMKINLG